MPVTAEGLRKATVDASAAVWVQEFAILTWLTLMIRQNMHPGDLLSACNDTIHRRRVHVEDRRE